MGFNKEHPKQAPQIKASFSSAAPQLPPHQGRTSVRCSQLRSVKAMYSKCPLKHKESTKNESKSKRKATRREPRSRICFSQYPNPTFQKTADQLTEALTSFSPKGDNHRKLGKLSGQYKQ